MMSVEKNLQISKDLFELNGVTMKKLIELDAEAFQKYIATTKSFGEKLPELKSFTAMMELQKDYGKTLWDDSQETMKARGEIFRDAYEQTTELMQSVSVEPASPAKKSKAA